MRPSQNFLNSRKTRKWGFHIKHEDCLKVNSGRGLHAAQYFFFFLENWLFSAFVVFLAPPGRLIAPWVCSGPARSAPTWACSSPGSWPVSLVLRSSQTPPWRLSFNQVNICAAVSHQWHSRGPANGTTGGAVQLSRPTEQSTATDLKCLCSDCMCHLIRITDASCSVFSLSVCYTLVK